MVKLHEDLAQACKERDASISDAEALKVKVKNLASEADKLREQVTSLETAVKKSSSELEQACADSAQVGDVHQKNAYLVTKVAELEKHLERANIRHVRMSGNGEKVCVKYLVAFVF